MMLTRRTRTTLALILTWTLIMGIRIKSMLLLGHHATHLPSSSPWKMSVLNTQGIRWGVFNLLATMRWPTATTLGVLYPSTAAPEAHIIRGIVTAQTAPTLAVVLCGGIIPILIISSHTTAVCPAWTRIRTTLSAISVRHATIPEAITPQMPLVADKIILVMISSIGTTLTPLPVHQTMSKTAITITKPYPTRQTAPTHTTTIAQAHITQTVLEATARSTRVPITRQTTPP
ncbi:hypothetical protein QBC42DRAFT_257528 [Cladorrhinum samala]|uniref:Uncharacterized protein n=1 Tax=Cladorrhinum samala TaxID=585594 RepID=A0AAV9I1U4_9PEZI|nr:hypothetical protein QBC42DRAFT_257528 [Cladorrhinum samala]